MNTMTMKAVAMLAAGGVAAGAAAAEPAIKGSKAVYWVSAETTSGVGAIGAGGMMQAAMTQSGASAMGLLGVVAGTLGRAVVPAGFLQMIAYGDEVRPPTRPSLPIRRRRGTPNGWRRCAASSTTGAVLGRPRHGRLTRVAA